MVPGLPLLASLVAVAQAAPATPRQFSGGWCRPSNGVEPKAYLHYEWDLGWKPSSEECLAACQEKLEDNLACSEFSDDNACYCMAMSVFGGAVTDFCWSRASPRTLSYVVGIGKPRDCGEGHDCCRCDWVETEHGGDNCASWNFNEEWRKCLDGSMPIPTGKECYSGLGEILTCCEPCVDEQPNRDSQVCYHHHVEECDFGEEDWASWMNKALIGSFVGTILGIALVVGASLPVCCGIGKDSNLMCPAIAIGLIAGFCFFIPLIAGLVASDLAIDEHCEKCHCDEDDWEEAHHNMNVFTALVAYVHGLGFVVVVVAIAAEVLACCMCFRCCGPLSKPLGPDVPAAHRQQPVLGMVVGSPTVDVPVDSGDDQRKAQPRHQVPPLPPTNTVR